jgi:putative heme transporter
MRSSSRRVLTVVVAAAALTLVLAVPRSAGTSWARVGSALAAVPLLTLAGLAVVWLGGLVCSSVALAASLPGLTVRRALVLSLSGSAVANVLPLGGAAGIGLNFAMTRRWGFSTGSITAYTATTNVCDVVGKLVVAAVAGVLLTTAGSSPLLHDGRLAGLGLAVLLPLGLVVLLHPRGAAVLGAAADRVTSWAGAVVGRTPGSRLSERLPWLARTTTDLVRRRWRRLGAGTLGYVVLLGVLLDGCLHAAGLALPLPLLVVVLAVDRLLTMVPLTPGGAGVVEGGTTLALTALGVPPGTAVAGVLLYRTFTYFVEIPVGGLVALVWTLRQRRGRRDVPDAPTTPRIEAR